VLGFEIAIRCEDKRSEVGIRFVASHKQSAFVFASTLELKVLARLLMLDVEFMLRVQLNFFCLNFGKLKFEFLST
jgi:hypothetical protein